MVKSIKQNTSKWNGIGYNRQKCQTKSCNSEGILLTTHHFDSSQYVLMIDFKYSVVMLLILIGFAMFTCG